MGGSAQGLHRHRNTHSFGATLSRSLGLITLLHLIEILLLLLPVMRPDRRVVEDPQVGPASSLFTHLNRAQPSRLVQRVDDALQERLGLLDERETRSKQFGEQRRRKDDEFGLIPTGSALRQAPLSVERVLPSRQHQATEL